MMRSMVYSALALAIVGQAAIGQEETSLDGPDYYAGYAPQAAPAAPVATAEGTCPDGTCPDGYAGAGGLCLLDRHGHGLFHGGPHHMGLAYLSGYPSGVANYGNPPHCRDWKGPGLSCRTCSNGECLYRFYGQPDLFYNYYAWPSCTGLGAELYVSPRPVPPHAGWTYVTYQPLYPHEFLYSHHRTYHRYYNGGQGLNRTHVSYGSLPWPLNQNWGYQNLK